MATKTARGIARDPLSLLTPDEHERLVTEHFRTVVAHLVAMAEKLNQAPETEVSCVNQKRRYTLKITSTPIH